jgi:hypothetical protein
MAARKSGMTASTKEAKTFSYSLNGVELNFTLRVDSKGELVAAKMLLTQAIADFDKELNERF